MAKKQLPQKQIFNLLKPFKAPPTSWDRVYDWIVNRARVVMVFAEIIVVVSFVAKVAVDIQAKNLDEQLSLSRENLQFIAKEAEPRIRAVQQKAEAYSRIWNGSYAYSDILAEINSYIQNPDEDMMILLDGDKVTIRGGTTIDDLIEIEAKMRASETFGTVTIPILVSESTDLDFGTGKYSFSAIIDGEPLREEINSNGR